MMTRFGQTVVARTFRIPEECDQYLKAVAAGRRWNATMVLIDILKQHQSMSEVAAGAVANIVDERQLALPRVGESWSDAEYHKRVIEAHAPKKTTKAKRAAVDRAVAKARRRAKPAKRTAPNKGKRKGAKP
jgi:hypothetical protein